MAAADGGMVMINVIYYYYLDEYTIVTNSFINLASFHSEIHRRDIPIDVYNLVSKTELEV